MDEDKFLYGLVDSNSIVENVVLGENDQSGAILSAMFDDLDVIRATLDTGFPIIGGDYVDGVFRQPKPFESWVWDTSEKNWKAPSERPDFPCFWDETSKSWLPIPS